MAFDAGAAARRGGWWLIAVALALSIYAGFPETTYIDGLLAACWFGWRCGCCERSRLRAYASKVAVGTGVGVLLAAPLLVAFVGYAIDGYASSHLGGGLGRLQIPHVGLPQLVLPYVYGQPWQFLDPSVEMGPIWNGVGGYLSASLLFFGLLGVAARGRRGLRFVLLGWIVLALARMYGEPPLLGHILGVLPGMSNIAFYRYATPSVELSAIVLAAIGLDGLVKREIPWRRVLAVTAGALLVVGAATIGAVSLVHQIAEPSHRIYARVSVILAVAVVLAGGLVAFVRSSRARYVLASAIVCLEALVLFVPPELSAPRGIFIDMAPVTFLQSHLGLSRYFTLGPLDADYGSYYGIRQLNADDALISSAFARYVNTRLDPTAVPGNFNGAPTTPGQAPDLELDSHLDGYRDAGIRYVLTPRGFQLPQGPGQFTLVLRTETTWIYRLAGTQPYFSATSPGCTVTPHGGATVRLSCPTETTLIRRETYMPGWSAEVDGHSTSIHEYDNTFQAVTVTRGSHLVTFGYAPPYIGWAFAAFLLGCASLVVPPLWVRRRQRARAPASAP